MTARVTKQIVVGGYTGDPDVRVTSMALEVIRTVAGVNITPPTPGGRKTIVCVVSS